MQYGGYGGRRRWLSLFLFFSVCCSEFSKWDGSLLSYLTCLARCLSYVIDVLVVSWYRK
jgi:hypothetical protein